MRGVYPAKRVISLFQAYDAFSHHPQLVDLLVKPHVRAELGGLLTGLLPAWDRRLYVERFVDELNRMWYQAKEGRELSRVDDLKINLTDINLRISWKLTHDLSEHEIFLNLATVSYAYANQLAIREYQRLDRVIDLVKTLGE